MKMIKYGEMIVKIGEDIIYKLDIVAKNNIRKKEIWDYYKDFLCNITDYIMLEGAFD